MRISLNWLREFVDIAAEPPAVGRHLTNVGLTVDAIETAGDDTVFELDVTTNRPDCLNHLGVARELSVIFGSALRKPEFKLIESSKRTSDVFSIDISDPELCGRYVGRYISGVKIGPSPDWLKRRLETSGVRPINNVADVTNYVLMELGQPLHAFDADKLEGKEIIVRRAGRAGRAGIEDKITTLDGIERVLSPSVLVIADRGKPVALAGVMGGSDSEISDRTVHVFLESAYFQPQSIRKTARTLSLNTEASYRFERGADIEIAAFACDRAAALIQKVAGGDIFSSAIDVYPGKRGPVVVSLRRSRIALFLGAPVDDAVVEGIFQKLEFKWSRTAEGWTVGVPSFRVDVSHEQDLLEELARHYGFDRFPSTLPRWGGFGSALPGEAEERRLRSVLEGKGYDETATYSFSDEETERRYRPDIEPVKFQNPMTEDATVLRTSLVPGILKTILWNLNRGAPDLQLYELSKVYSRKDERRVLILAACGALRSQNIHDSEKEFGFFDIKGDVESILETFHLNAINTSSDGIADYYHPGRSVRIADVAIVGEVHPELLENLKIRRRVWIAEIEAGRLIGRNSEMQVSAIPRFPAVRRDFSLLLNKGTQYAAVRQIITGAGIPELLRVEPFDRMDSGSFPESRYSLSISVTYQSGERTLTDTEVESFDRKLLEILEQRLGAQLRT